MNWISSLLGDHPKGVLIFIILIFIPLLSFFVIYPFEIECDVRRGFANKNGRAVKELSRFSNFYNISLGGLEIWGILTKNKTFGEDLLINSNSLDEVARLHQHVWNSTAEFEGRQIKFQELASVDINYVLHYFRKLLDIEWMPGVNLDFPSASAFGNSFYLGSQFFGVNGKEDNQAGPMKSAKFVALWYMSRAETLEEKKMLQAIQLGVFKTSVAGNFSDLIDFEMFGDQVANAEMLRGTMTTVKLFIIGGVLMITFMAFTFSDLTIFSQIMLIIGAIGSPLAATAACFALLGWVGHPFSSIMSITPFLILGIGVDDAFLLLNCWRQEDKNYRMKTSSERDIQARLGRVIREISPSMAITSLTNTMAFGVGYLSPTPQMSSFCLGTALAIVLDFIFEFLIFVPCMVLFYEKRELNRGIEKKVPRDPIFTWQKFTKILLSTPGKLGVGMLYLGVMSASYYGTMKLETTFDPSKTFPADSKLVDYLESFTYIQKQYSPLNFLTKLPDMKKPYEVFRFEEMVDRLETREGCYGRDMSHNMYNDFTQYLTSSNSTYSYQHLEKFLKNREMADRNTIKWHKDWNETIVDEINFVVVCRGQSNWAHRAASLESTRSIIDEYPEFETSIFDYDATIYDLINTVKGELFKSLGITFTCMTLACFFIMPSIVAPTIASIATVSISFCLVGFLSLWGQNLDPVTMIDVIMAIGFSVDYSAHVCFHYYCAYKKNYYNSKEEVITQVLSQIGRPVIEASVTTLLCMAPLFVVPVYMIKSFAKTVTLVTTFGLLHGLLFLPVVLYFIPLKTQRTSLPVSLTEEPLVRSEEVTK